MVVLSYGFYLYRSMVLSLFSVFARNYRYQTAVIMIDVLGGFFLFVTSSDGWMK